jgi:hypothetical protein
MLRLCQHLVSAAAVWRHHTAAADTWPIAALHITGDIADRGDSDWMTDLDRLCACDSDSDWLCDSETEWMADSNSVSGSVSRTVFMWQWQWVWENETEWMADSNGVSGSVSRTVFMWQWLWLWLWESVWKGDKKERAQKRFSKKKKEEETKGWVEERQRVTDREKGVDGRSKEQYRIDITSI